MELLASGLVWLVSAVIAAAVLVGVTVVVRVSQRDRGRTIRVVGIGGGGANAVEAMIRSRIRGVEYVVVNTDVRALRRSSARTKVAIGKSVTHGLGAGGDVSSGEIAAREGATEIGRALAGSDLVVITAGLGGGTGSGAAPVVAEVARQAGALTLAVVTKPFRFEGARRRETAQDAAAALVGLVDAMATVPNDRVRDVSPADVTVEEAFGAIDEVLSRSVREIVDLIGVPGRLNLDFADVRGVLQGSGAAAVGFGRAAGENRATEATRKALAATLLEARVEGASSVLVNVSGSRKLRLAELDAVADAVLAAAGRETNLVFGTSIQPWLREEVKVTLIATGVGRARTRQAPMKVPIKAPMQAPAAEAPEPMQALSEPTESVEATPPVEANPAGWRPMWLRRSTPAEPKPEPAPDAPPAAEAPPAPRTRPPRAKGRSAAGRRSARAATRGASVRSARGKTASTE